MAGWYGTRDDDAAVAAIHRAVDLGVTLFDTSDLYGGGDNEKLVGKALKDRRDKVVLSTKFGNTWDEKGWPNGVNAKPEYAKKAIDASLSRLGVDVIDLYYLHRVDPDVPVEESIGAMSEMVKEGKVRYIGVSEVNPDTLQRAHATHPLTALQTEYSLWSREPETELFALCDRLGIGFVGYAPLGRGLLSGTIKSPDDLPEGDIRRVLPRFQTENLKRNEKLLEYLRKLSAEKGCTPAQLALAWILKVQSNVIPLQGADRAPFVEENVGAIDVNLSDDEVAKISAANLPGGVEGGRYPEEWMDEINR